MGEIINVNQENLRDDVTTLRYTSYRRRSSRPRSNCHHLYLIPSVYYQTLMQQTIPTFGKAEKDGINLSSKNTAGFIVRVNPKSEQPLPNLCQQLMTTLLNSRNTFTQERIMCASGLKHTLTREIRRSSRGAFLSPPLKIGITFLVFMLRGHAAVSKDCKKKPAAGMSLNKMYSSF